MPVISLQLKQLTITIISMFLNSAYYSQIVSSTRMASQPWHICLLSVDNIEALASKLKNIVQWRKAQFLPEEEIESEWCMTPERPYHVPESTWFAPSRRNQKGSRIPHRTVYESDVESADDDDAAQDGEDEPDIHGFIHTKDGWLCTKTRFVFTTHSCQ